MRFLLISIYLLITYNGFSQDYLLKDENLHKTMIADFIQKSVAEKKLKKNPVIVVNERVLKENELDELGFYKSDIIGISLLGKDNVKIVDIYGEQSLNGVVLIETKPLQQNSTESVSENKVLYLLNDKPIDQTELEKIDPDIIESIEVIKNKKEIKKYTAEKYDGVVKINLKKKD